MISPHFGSVSRVVSVQRTDRTQNPQEEFAKTKTARDATWDLSFILRDPTAYGSPPGEEVMAEMEAVRDLFQNHDRDYQGPNNTVSAGGINYSDVQTFRLNRHMYLATGKEAEQLADVHHRLNLVRTRLFANRQTNGLVYDKNRRDYKYHLKPEFRQVQQEQARLMTELAAKASLNLSLKVSDINKELPGLPQFRIHQLNIQKIGE